MRGLNWSRLKNIFQKTNGQKTDAPPVDHRLLKRLKECQKLGLRLEPPAAVRYHKELPLVDLGIQIVSEPMQNLSSADLDRLLDRQAADKKIAEIHVSLQAAAARQLIQVEGLFAAFVKRVAADAPWLGIPKDEVQARFLTFPAKMDAEEANRVLRQRGKDLAQEANLAKKRALEAKIKPLTQFKLHGKVVSARRPVSLPFLTANLELELNLDLFLEPRDIDQLVTLGNPELSLALERLLEKSKRGLLAKLDEQLKDLARRIRKLPHIDLLNDGEIATTIAPYYGGINRDLKKRRAKSALVAVEERAREAKYLGDVVKLNERRAAYADVASYYPLARSMQRQLVLYVGPTNSGKTWRALNDLAQEKTGAYLAPLRLLALEGQEELEKRGKVTSFLTGEERDLRPDATFTSSTIEMLNLETPLDAVVVDEAQLLADERRGWAWLQAIVGAPAKKIIMTSSPDATELIEMLAQYLGEQLTIHTCQRYNELHVAEKPMRLEQVRAGMAVVCFSRRDVQRIKTQILAATDYKVAVVYGNLSPQVRREEARRFRSGEAQILVATDAIAMGLNLPISEVLFYTTEKFNGEEISRLTPSEIRQIGGRAGRYGFAQFGVVNALSGQSLAFIREAMVGQTEKLGPPFYVAPGHNHIRIISEVLETKSLERVLTFFERAIEFSDERFQCSNIDDLSFLSSFVDERLPFLSLEERLTIATAPVGVRNETVVGWYIDRMLSCFQDPAQQNYWVDNLDDLFQEAERFTRPAARHHSELRDAEDYLKTLTVYAWLAFRYPEVFRRIEECEAARETVNAFVERSLRDTPTKTCSACGDKLAPGSRYKLCEKCFEKKDKRSIRTHLSRKQGERSSKSGRRSKGKVNRQWQ